MGAHDIVRVSPVDDILFEKRRVGHDDLDIVEGHDLRTSGADVRYDAMMAREFGVELECTWFQNPSMGELWTFFSNSLLAGHPILAGGQKKKRRSRPS